MRINVIGLGYIGLPTAAVLAEAGNEVLGVDINETRVSAVNQGLARFGEYDLDNLINKAVVSGNLIASTIPTPAQVYVLAVPTPLGENKSVDLSHLLSACHLIAPFLEDQNLVVIESTVPPGTTELIQDELSRLRPDLIDSLGQSCLYFAHAPERVIPGNTLQEIINNSRVIGGTSEQAGIITTNLYKSFCKGDIHRTDAKTAELIKLAENAYRDVNIAFANEFSQLARELGVDDREAISLANYHPRVNILSPGPGVGGHCIAVDPWFLVQIDPENTTLIQAARNINDSRPNKVIEEVIQIITNNEEITSIGILGLAFKKNIGDLRESPALQITETLISILPNHKFFIFEPNIDHLPESLIANQEVNRAFSLQQLANSTDLLLLLVDHDEFKLTDKTQIENKAIVDTRGFWS